jgi:anaerobic magnesium-protoporphyrin IX monomethyl ester cyclase
MKVLLVIPPNIGRYVVATIPHAGIAYLSAILKKSGHETALVDMRIHISNDYLFGKIDVFKPDMIGMTTAAIGYKMAYDIIDAIKSRYPNIPVAIGGSFASTVHSKILEDTQIDYVIYGEGERTFLDLANGKDPKDISGLIYRNDGEIEMNAPYPLEKDLDKLPFPDYDIFDLDSMLEKRIPLVSTRGCPNRCTFCSIQLVMGHPFRTRSPENVLEEIKYWYNRGYKTFEFSDDNFTFNMPRAEQICDLIIGSGMGLKLIFGNGLRADRVNPTLLRKLKDAGTSWIAYSLESSNTESLKMLKKDLTLRQLRKSVEDTKSLGIQVQVNFIIGNPGETYEQFLDDLKVAEELDVDQLRFYNMIPYPGTEMYEWVKQNGRFLHEPEDFLNNLNYWGEEPVFETDEFTRKERIKAYRIGNAKIMQLFLKRHFGRFFGALGFRLWKQPFVQKYGMDIATRAWIGIKRLRIRQA